MPIRGVRHWPIQRKISAPYSVLVIAVIGMTAGAILGSWVGTKVRAYVPENVFRHGVRILITVLAVRMLLQGFGILN